MAVSITNADAVLKVRYARDLSRILMMDPMMEPFMALTARKKGDVIASAVGKVFHVPFKTRDGQAAGYSFAKAQGKSDGVNGGSSYTGFDVPVIPGYATGRVDGQAIAVSQGNDNAFIDLMDEETKGALRQAQQEIAFASFKSGTGSRGRIGTITAGDPSITLTVAADATYFEIDMALVAAAADGTGSVRSTTAVLVTGINPVSGKIYLSADPTGLGWSTGSGGDYLFLDGDFVASTKTKIIGIGGYIPTTAPTVGESFNGVDRSLNWKLYGLRHDASTSTNFASSIVDATGKIRHFAKGKTTHGYCNPINWATLANSLEASRRTTINDDKYNLSFKAIEMDGMTGSFPLLPDSNVPKGLCYLTNAEHIYWIHAGEDLAYVAQEDGNFIRAKGDADAFEVRVRSQANLVIDDPSQFCVIYNVT